MNRHVRVWQRRRYIAQLLGVEPSELEVVHGG